MYDMYSSYRFVICELLFMCLFIYFIVYWGHSKFVYEFMFLMYLVMDHIHWICHDFEHLSTIWSVSGRIIKLCYIIWFFFPSPPPPQIIVQVFSFSEKIGSIFAALSYQFIRRTKLAELGGAAKEISFKLWKPLSTRFGDLVPIEGLSFRDVRPSVPQI